MKKEREKEEKKIESRHTLEGHLIYQYSRSLADKSVEK